jgi:hypothetical protein
LSAYWAEVALTDHSVNIVNIFFVHNVLGLSKGVDALLAMVDADVLIRGMTERFVLIISLNNVTQVG